MVLEDKDHSLSGMPAQVFRKVLPALASIVSPTQGKPFDEVGTLASLLLTPLKPSEVTDVSPG